MGEEEKDSGEFRILNDEEFSRLSTTDKVDYMRKAIEAQKRINEQIARGLFQIDPEALEKLIKP